MNIFKTDLGGNWILVTGAGYTHAIKAGYLLELFSRRRPKSNSRLFIDLDPQC